MASVFAKSSICEWRATNVDACNMLETYSYGVGKLCA